MIVLSKENIIYMREDIIDEKLKLIQKTKFFTIDSSLKFDLRQSGTDKSVEDFFSLVSLQETDPLINMLIKKQNYFELINLVAKKQSGKLKKNFLEKFNLKKE